jgi:hypothetical protein
VEKITPLAKDFLLVVLLQAQPLFQMYFSNPFQQQVMGGFIDGV